MVHLTLMLRLTFHSRRAWTSVSTMCLQASIIVFACAIPRLTLAASIAFWLFVLESSFFVSSKCF